jgi:hypothetical protein
LSKSVEGIEIKNVDKIMWFDEFMQEFINSIKSSFTYQNARNIKELQEKAEFVVIK